MTTSPLNLLSFKFIPFTWVIFVFDKILFYFKSYFILFVDFILFMDFILFLDCGLSVLVKSLGSIPISVCHPLILPSLLSQFIDAWFYLATLSHSVRECFFLFN